MKGTRLYSIFRAKCPVCHIGDVFDNSGAYDLGHLDKMHETCSHCGHKYEKEPGFWYGAMYASYALTVAMSVAAFILTYWIYPAATVWIYISVIVGVLILMAPVTFRASRLVWINLFAHYNPLKAKAHEQI
ncbi:MAG: DUF983 domain-containing protein [Flavobacteriia bacterium]|jgi:uncharacterized protein (DUF983 family)